LEHLHPLVHVGGHHVPDLNLNIFSNLSRGPKDGLTTFGSGVQEIALAWVGSWRQ